MSIEISNYYTNPDFFWAHVPPEDGIYQVPIDPQCYSNPQADKKLLDFFLDENFDEENIDTIDLFLSKYANANQQITLTPTLIKKITHSLMWKIIPRLLIKSRYNILYHPNFDKESIGHLLHWKKYNPQLKNVPENLLEKIALQELEYQFPGVFTNETPVSLLWVAVMLQKPELVKKLLSAEKSADIFSPSHERIFYSHPAFLPDKLLELSTTSEAFDILQIFFDFGAPKQIILSYKVRVLFLKSIEMFDLNAATRFLDYFSPETAVFCTKQTKHLYENFWFHKNIENITNFFEDSNVTPFKQAIYNRSLVFFDLLSSRLTYIPKVTEKQEKYLHEVIETRIPRMETAQRTS